MTGTLPQWSPLNDPQLSAYYQGQLGDKREEVREKTRLVMDLLSRYAWQEYPIKYGIWVVKDKGVLTGNSTLSGPWTKRVYEPDYRWIQILDPSTRHPIAVHEIDTAYDGRKQAPLVPFNPHATTSIWFAGDVRAFGLFTTVGDGHMVYFGAREATRQPYEAWRKGPEHFAQWTATIGTAFDRQFGPSASERAWIADHPQPPENPKRFGVF